MTIAASTAASRAITYDNNGRKMAELAINQVLGSPTQFVGQTFTVCWRLEVRSITRSAFYPENLRPRPPARSSLAWSCVAKETSNT